MAIIFKRREIVRLQQTDRSWPRYYTLKSCLTELARLGGYLNRSKDDPPGNIVIMSSAG